MWEAGHVMMMFCWKPEATVWPVSRDLCGLRRECARFLDPQNRHSMIGMSCSGAVSLVMVRESSHGKGRESCRKDSERNFSHFFQFSPPSYCLLIWMGKGGERKAGVEPL